MQFSTLLLALPAVVAQKCIIKDYNTNAFVHVQNDDGYKYFEATEGEDQFKLFIAWNK